jgi:hypothetical protein
MFLTRDKAENNITLHYITYQQTILQFLKATPPPFFGRAYYSVNNPDNLRSYTRNAGFENTTLEKVTLMGQSATSMDAGGGSMEGSAIIQEIRNEGPELLNAIASAIVAEINDRSDKSNLIRAKRLVRCTI